MSTPKQPDDKNVERPGMAPPWKRGEASAATGLTAGQMAKAAGVGDDRPAPGPTPTGAAGSAPNDDATRAIPVGGAPATQQTPRPTGPPTGQQAPQSPQNPQAGGPAPRPAGGQAPPTQTPPAPKPAPEQSKSGDQQTRNIPREDLVKKDELPDLDSIHHSEQVKEQAIARAASQTIPARSVGVPLRAAVQLRRVDPWSVFKISGVLSVAGFFIWMIAVAILYGILSGMGVWDQINSSFGTIVNGDGSTSGQDLISSGQVFTFSALFGVVAAVLLTALSTISAYIYNVCADMVGGVEVTLADLD